MAQQRFWNFKEDDLTSLLIRWMTGLHPSGRYFGYDFNATGDLNLNLVHSTTGFKYVNVTPAESAFLSLVMTRQGTMILEDGPVTINNISAGDVTNPRIDLIILTHERIESAGGSQALYSVIEGTPAASPSAPAVTDALRQTIIGELLIPANTTLLTDGGVVWTPSKKPTFAGGSPLDDINLGANKALETDASGGVIGSAITSTELSRLAGVTSSIQTQINSKQATVVGAASTVTSSNLTINRALISDASGKIAVHSTVSSTELGYLNGVTSAIQTQLNTLDSDKQDNITGGASTITASDLTVSRALVSDGSGKVAVSAVTSTELGYLDGATSSIQTQINTKESTIVGAASTITASNLTVSRVLISNATGKVAVHSTVSDTELGYLNGVTSNVQTQLDTKSDIKRTVYTGTFDTTITGQNTMLSIPIAINTGVNVEAWIWASDQAATPAHAYSFHIDQAAVRGSGNGANLGSVELSNNRLGTSTLSADVVENAENIDIRVDQGDAGVNMYWHCLVYVYEVAI